LNGDDNGTQAMIEDGEKVEPKRQSKVTMVLGVREHRSQGEPQKFWQAFI